MQEVEDAHPETVSWLWERPNPFQERLSQPKDHEHRLLWISGKPGSGKSTLMKHIFKDERPETVRHIFRQGQEIPSEKASLLMLRYCLSMVRRPMDPNVIDQIGQLTLSISICRDRRVVHELW